MLQDFKSVPDHFITLQSNLGQETSHKSQLKIKDTTAACP